MNYFKMYLCVLSNGFEVFTPRNTTRAVNMKDLTVEGHLHELLSIDKIYLKHNIH